MENLPEDIEILGKEKKRRKVNLYKDKGEIILKD